MRLPVLLLLLLGLIVPACSRSDARKPGPLRIVVTVPPLVGLIKPLAPPDATVTGLMQPGRSEHGYEFTPRDLATLGEADIVVYIGLGLEPAVETYLKKHPSSRRRDICFADVAGIAADDHAHHHHDEHTHECIVDVHLWMDPDLCLKLVDAASTHLRDAIKAVGRTDWSVDDAATNLKAQVRALDEETRARLAPLAGRSIVTHHNAWQRLADRYGLKVAAVIRPTDGEPTPGAISAAVDAIRKQGARAVFVEPQFDPAAARRIADAAGVRLAILDPLGSGDHFATTRANVDALVKALAD